MRRLLLIDAVLLVLLALLSAANRHFDRKALMGSQEPWGLSPRRLSMTFFKS